MPSLLSAGQIRQFLIDTLLDQEVDLLCYDYFRDVYEAFSVGMSKRTKIQLLVETCDRQGRFNELLELVKRLNPHQYEQFKTRLYRSE